MLPPHAQWNSRFHVFFHSLTLCPESYFTLHVSPNFHSISVPISQWFIPLSPSMPVSYFTVSASEFLRPLILSNSFSFFLSPRHISVRLRSVSIFPLSLSLPLKLGACGRPPALAWKCNPQADHVSINGCCRRALLNVGENERENNMFHMILDTDSEVDERTLKSEQLSVVVCMLRVSRRTEKICLAIYNLGVWN